MKKENIIDIQAKYSTLCEKISHYNYHYYNKNESLISDEEYDSLYRELMIFEKKYSYCLDLTNSPTKTVGYSVTNGTYHKFPMLSLANCWSEKDSINFYDRICKALQYEPLMVCEPKLDGIALSIFYLRNRLVQVLTRGNGVQGEDITYNAKYVSNIPQALDSNYSELYIRAEAVIHKDNFQLISNKFSNSRNAVAGILRSYKTSFDYLKLIAIYAYEIANSPFDTQIESLNFLSKIGFTVPTPYFTVNRDQLISSLSESIKTISPYHTDGLVYKINNLKEKEKCGYTAKFPKSSFAYKFISLSLKTQVIDINFHVTRYGLIVPVATLDNVVFQNVNISKVTLHSLDFMTKHKINLGNTVIIQRAGGVIPKFIENLTPGIPFKKPTVCPSCQFNLDSDYMCHQGWLCKDQKIKRIEYACSSAALNIKGISNKTIIFLIEKDIVNSLDDIFRLPDLSAYLGMKKFENICISINRARNNLSFCNFIKSLSIPLIGQVNAQLLSTHFNDKKLSLFTSQEEYLNTIIGQKASNSFVRYTKNNTVMIQNLISQIRFA